MSLTEPVCNCRGHDYRMTHNGGVIVDADVAGFPEFEERLLKGFLGFQDLDDGVAFRDVRIRPPQP